MRGWLWTIARHKVIDNYRATSRRPQTVPLDTSSGTGGREKELTSDTSGGRTTLQVLVMLVPLPNIFRVGILG